MNGNPQNLAFLYRYFVAFCQDLIIHTPNVTVHISAMFNDTNIIRDVMRRLKRRVEILIGKCVLFIHIRFYVNAIYFAGESLNRVSVIESAAVCTARIMGEGGANTAWNV